MKFTWRILFAMYPVESVKVNLIFNVANTCMYSNLSFLNLSILQNTFQPGYNAATFAAAATFMKQFFYLVIRASRS